MSPISTDVLIVGAGPTGLYAAYYAGFRGWSTAVLDNLPEAGGQITAMYPEKDIFDVAGFPSIRGRVLVQDLKEQADQFQPQYFLGRQAVSLDASETGEAVVTTSDGQEIRAKAVVITGGIGSFRPRPLPAGADWDGRGLAFFVPRPDEYADKDVVIVGGGDSALDWALMLQPTAKSISVVHRRDKFRAHGSMITRAQDLGVSFYTPHEVTALRGDEMVSQIEITHKKDGAVTVLPVDAVVAALGFIANIGPIAEWGLEVDKRRIVVNTDMSTNIPRIFAAGDITVYPGKVPLLSVGFGEAALAINNAAPFVSPDLGVFPGHSSGDAT
jgi:thioredoxin reductase